jgi:NAD(P)-dependent dehydrogenase (short-subunit alcohol dehydrogenase family)
MLLEGRRCMIAGAAADRGIGAAVVDLFLEHGARVVVVDRAWNEHASLRITERSAQQHGSLVGGVMCDLTDVAACGAAIDEAADVLGGIDCLVNTVGSVATHPLLDITSAGFDSMIDTNLRSAFNICQAVLGKLAVQRSGTIVNVASVAAQRGGGLVGGAHYAAAKGGVISMTKTIAREFGPLGIRANVVCPSMIRTSMIDDVASTIRDSVVSQVPLGRLGEPGDVAGACLFLSSDLSSYVTGTTLDVNGGFHIH